MPDLLLNIIMLISLSLLIALQTSRSIVLRTLGLFTIFLGITSYYSVTGFNSTAPYMIGISLGFAILGLLSDFYSATLRTWFFRANAVNTKSTIYGTLIGILLIPVIFNINVVHGIVFGTLFGSLVGELQANKYNKDFKRVIKSNLGTMIGLYGMGIKILFAIQVIDIFFILRSAF